MTARSALARALNDLLFTTGHFDRAAWCRFLAFARGRLAVTHEDDDVNLWLDDRTVPSPTEIEAILIELARHRVMSSAVDRALRSFRETMLRQPRDISPLFTWENEVDDPPLHVGPPSAAAQFYHHVTRLLHTLPELRGDVEHGTWYA